MPHLTSDPHAGDSSTTDVGHQGRAAGTTARDQLRASTAVALMALRLRAGLLAVLAVTALGMGGLVGGLWPPLEETFADLPDEVIDVLATALAGSDLTSPAGWVNVELLSFVAPALVIAAAVLLVVRSLPEAEQSRRLGLLTAMPVRRTAYLLAVATAAALGVALVAASVVAAILLADVIGDLGLDLGASVAVGVHLAALGWCFGGIALLFGALTGRSRSTGAATAGVATVSFVITVFLPLSDRLAEWARLSPWYYYNSSDPLTGGVDLVHVLVLVVLAVLTTALAASVLQRRDLEG